MDISSYLELLPAPRAVFDHLAERRDRVRFLVPTADGSSRAVTWGDFAGQIRRAALFLATEGLRPTERAAVFAPNRVEWLSAALAIQAAGGVMTPIYPASTAEQAAYVVMHSDARVVFVDTAAILGRILAAWKSYAGVRRIVLLGDDLDVAAVHATARDKGHDVPLLEEVTRKVVTWSRALAMGGARDREDPQAFERTLAAVSLDQPGLLLYTSGTSGDPKGVPLSHRNVAVNGRDWLTSNAPLLDEGATDLLWLPMSHIFGYGEACLGNTLGMTTTLADPATALARLPEVRPSVFMSVPSLWEKLAAAVAGEPTVEARRARLAALTGGRLRFCLSGGAGLSLAVKELFWECGLLIIEGYGLTETSPTLTLNRPDAFRFDSVGKPLPSVELRLADDGEILARGPSVFVGYHKDPAATRAAFDADGWFQTGDVGRFTADGFLQIVDRKKDILVTAGGKNVPPANIERRFADDPLFANVVVYGDGKRYLVAGVWPSATAIERASGAADPVAALTALVQRRIDEVNATLASYETIKRFAILDRPLTVDAGLLTPTLKLRRRRVYDAFRAELEVLYA